MTGEGGTKSKLYPLFDIAGPYAGADVNGFGFKLIPLSEKSSPALTSSIKMKSVVVFTPCNGSKPWQA